MLLIALEGSRADTVAHVAKYLRDTYGFIVLDRTDLLADAPTPAEGLDAYLKAFTESRRRKVTTHADAKSIGIMLRYKPNSKGRPTAVPLGFEYFEDHAGIILRDVDDDALTRLVRANEGALWYVFEPGAPRRSPFTVLRTGDKLLLHNSSLARLNTAASMVLGGESIVNTLEEAANEVQ